MTRASEDELRFDPVRVGACYFLAFGVIVALAFPTVVAGVEGFILGVTGLGVLSRRRWGYVLASVFSVLFLFALGAGTVIGYAMLRSLRRNRDVFR